MKMKRRLTMLAILFRSVNTFCSHSKRFHSCRKTPAMYRQQTTSTFSDGRSAIIKSSKDDYDFSSSSSSTVTTMPFKVNLLTIHQAELETLIDSWGYPKYRASQILQWVHAKGVDNFDHMLNIPKELRHVLSERTTIGSLHLQVERVSKDGTRKRAYRLFDGQLIESVLMPYEDGRNTACISSQAGCAQACSFCATGQMGFARQLTSDEIFEQVAKFAAELRKQDGRLSNIVFMGSFTKYNIDCHNRGFLRYWILQFLLFLLLLQRSHCIFQAWENHSQIIAMSWMLSDV